MLALVRAEHPPVEVHDLARPAQARPSVALQELATAQARDEAEILALALVRDRQPGVARERRTVSLVRPPSGKLRRSSHAGSSFASM